MVQGNEFVVAAMPDEHRRGALGGAFDGGQRLDVEPSLLLHCAANHPQRASHDDRRHKHREQLPVLHELVRQSLQVGEGAVYHDSGEREVLLHSITWERCVLGGGGCNDRWGGGGAWRTGGLADASLLRGLSA